MSDAWNPAAGADRRGVGAGQTVWRVHQSVLIDTPITPPWGSRPWAAVVWPDQRNPDGWARAMMPPGPTGRGYAADRLAPGDVIEFGADYLRQVSRKRSEMVPYRWYGVVAATAASHVAAVGPFPGPGPARQWAEAALHTWRQAQLVDLAGFAAPVAAPALPAPRATRAPVVEVRSAGDTTRVDDATHGALVVDTAVFAAAMSTDTADLVAALRDATTRGGQPHLTGAEPKATLAALVARHAPGHVVADAELVTTAPLPAVTAPLPVVGVGGREPVYYGHPDGSVERVDVDQGGGRRLRPSKQWTPDGFAWGYQGPGPTELAYALLADATGSAALAGRLAVRYSADTVAQFPQGQAWSQPVSAVAAWVDQTQTQQQRTTPSAAHRGPARDRRHDIGAGM